MVERKRRKIAKKPQTQNPDTWVTEGGVDPEIVPPVEEETKKIETKAETKTSEKQDNDRTYPHRISFDMEEPQYKRLKWASFDSERTMNSILREAIEEWMKARNY